MSPAVKEAGLRRIGRDPLNLAVARALRAAYRDLDKTFPQWADALFDESFLEHEGAQCLADVITRGRDASPTDLARRYVRSLNSNGDPALVREVEPAAAHLLDAFTGAIRAERVMAEVLDSKALDSAAEDIAAVRAALGAGRATEGTLWDYLTWTIDRNLYLDPRGTFQTQRQVQLKLDRIYVSLDASRVDDLNRRDRDGPTPAGPADLAMDKQGEGRDAAARHLVGVAGSGRADRASDVVSLHDAVAAHPRLVVLGDPGGGKTTLLRHLALNNAKRICADGLLAIGDGARVPILVRVAEYADSDVWRRAPLTDFLADYHRVADCSADALADLFTRELDAGHCLVLLDGLDEIAQTDERIAIVRRIEDFVRRHTRAGNTFVVTSREAGYRTAALGEGFAHMRAREMTREQVELFLGNWCQAVEDAQTPELPKRERQAVAAREITGILSAVDGTPGVARLAVNPLMLRVLALIHRTGAQLPQKRIALYKLAAETLTSTWRLAQGVPESALAEPEHVTRLLSVLARWMHVNRPSGIASEHDVLTVLGEEWARINGLPWDPDDMPLAVESEVRAFLERVRIQTGLFVERAPGRYGFLHLTFEEYFAARALIAKPRTRAKLIREHLHDPRWTEPILLALGFVGLDYPDDAAELVETAVLARGEAADDDGLTPTPLEDWLGQDFLFALRCLADEIPLAAPVARDLLGQAVREMFSGTGRGAFWAYRRSLSGLLSSLLSTVHGPPLVAAILDALDGASADKRRHWVTAASQVRDLLRQSELLARLMDLTADPDAEVRQDATSALDNVADQPGVVPRLLELTTDPNPDIRRQAALALDQATDQPGVVPRLLELTTDPDADIRGRATFALRQAADQPGVVPRLLELTTDPNPDIRRQAALALRRVADQPGVVPRLLELTTDPDASIRGQAASALDQATDQPGVLPRLLELTTDPDASIRGQAALALHQATDQLGVLPRLLELTTDPNEDVQCRAACALSDAVTQAGGPARLEKLVEEFGLDALVQNLQRIVRSDGPDDWLRAPVVPVLVLLYGRSPQVVDHLIEFLRDGGGDVRDAAAQGLVEIGQSSAEQRKVVREVLLDCLTDPRFDRRDKDEHRKAADSAYDALWGLEVAARTA